VQYLADQVPEKKLAPAHGTLERYRLQEWLTFISSELHKTFSPLFNKAISDEARTQTIARLHTRLALLEDALSGHAYLLGESFTVADAYAFTILRWCGMFDIKLTDYPNVSAYMERVGARPAVHEALKAEGLA
jgi:glutathione S-transferase